MTDINKIKAILENPFGNDLDDSGMPLLSEGVARVAKLAAYGLTNPEIAAIVEMPETAAVDYLRRAKKKLGTNKPGLTKELVRRLAVELGTEVEL